MLVTMCYNFRQPTVDVHNVQQLPELFKENAPTAKNSTCETGMLHMYQNT